MSLSDLPLSAVGLYIQDACHAHRYIRSRNDSGIVERPERLRSVAIGLAAAIARLEEVSAGASGTGSASVDTEASAKQSDLQSTSNANGVSDASNRGGVPQVKQESESLISGSITESSEASDALVNALDRLTITGNAVDATRPQAHKLGSKLSIIRSDARASLLDDPAVKYIHGDIEGPCYIGKFVKWTAQSAEKVARGESEIPEGLHQGDLYLCPQSLDAVSGALGTVCQAVDSVINASYRKGDYPASEERFGHSHAFVSVRPPGHHCGEDTPCGFCFVNNVMVGAAHAHLKHKINRVVVFDIDLHHGNGTQSIVWNINEEAYRAETEQREEEGEVHVSTSPEAPTKKLGQKLKIYYGSVHDVMSFPCEDGKPELIQAASTSLRGPHGQWIENVHLLPYQNDEEFFAKLYPRYRLLIDRASDFLEAEGNDEEVLVFISAGFDASLHEHSYMSRHGRKVPTSFYHRFTQDVAGFAAKYARSRIVSVLEGGYSARALSSGALAHVIGLAGVTAEKASEEWWSLENLIKLEKATKPSARRTSAAVASVGETWLERTVTLLPELDAIPIKSPNPKKGNNVPIAPVERMTLRDRKKVDSRQQSPMQSPQSLKKQAMQTTSTAPRKPSSTVRQNPTNRKQFPVAEIGIHGGKDPESGSISVIKLEPEEGSGTEPLVGPVSVGAGVESEGLEPKKAKKVILHVNPPSQRGS